jgi:hypothetical protein
MAIQENLYDNMFEDRPTGGLSAMQRREGLANIIAEKKNPDTEVITALTKQILGQGLTGKWTGQGRGSAEANARDMAKIMAEIGITDIKQFGKITRPVESYVGTDDSGNPIYETRNEETFGNKLTGQVVPNTYSERQKGDFFGGTFEGKGNTGYGVKFDSQGNPIFYTQGASSNDLANLMADLGPVFQIGMAIATGGLSIPQQIAAQMAVGVLSGQNMGDAIKNAAVSMAMAQIPGTDFMKEGGSFIKDLGLDPALTKTLNSSFQNAAMSGAKALLTGGDISDAVLRGAAAGGINGAINTITSNIDGFKDLSPTQQKLVVNAVTGVVSGKPLDQIIINSAIAAANAEVHNAKNPPSTAGVDKTIIGNFDDTEVTRLEKMGYTKDQIKEYFGRLENLTEVLDEPQETLPVETSPATRSLTSGAQTEEADDFLKSIGINTLDKPSDSGLSNQDILDMINADNGMLITSNRDKAQEHVFDPTYGGTQPLPGINPNELVITGNRDTLGRGMSDDIARNLEDAGGDELIITGNRDKTQEHVFDPTFGGTIPLPNEDPNELVITDDRPVKEPPAETPTTPGSTGGPSPTPKVNAPGTKPTAPALAPAAKPAATAKQPTAQSVVPALLGMPQLGNMFYYGKDFSSQKQELDPSGKLVQQEYDPLSVTQAGAELQLDKIAGSNENDVQALIEQIMASNGGNISPEELAQILGQGDIYG